MSLIGNLEDMGLADLLQFFGLSRKSGVLALRCERGQGRILFRDGLVLGARILGRSTDLRSLLAGSQVLDETQWGVAQREADRVGRSVADQLVAGGLVSSEAIQAVRRECLESAVLEMFGWEVGEFEFDLRAKPEPADLDLLLAHGVSAPYLAMEGARALDEAARDQRVGTQRPPEVTVAEPPSERSDLGADEGPGRAAPDRPSPAVVVIDPDLAVLEWTKRSLVDGARRVHIFQRSEFALERIRQYLGRAESPVVLLSPEVPGDPLSGIRDARDFVRRLKSQAPRTRVLWLVARGSDPRGGLGDADGVVERPESDQFSDPSAAPGLESLARGLRTAALGR